MVCLFALWILDSTNRGNVVLAVDPALVKYSSMFFLQPGGLALYDGDGEMARMGKER